MMARGEADTPCCLLPACPLPAWQPRDLGSSRKGIGATRASRPAFAAPSKPAFVPKLVGEHWRAFLVLFSLALSPALRI